MNKQEAVTLSQNTFNGGFDEIQFITFISNLFKTYEPLAANVSGGQLKEAFKPFVSHYKRIGKYTDAEGNVIDTIIVHLKKSSSLERARTAQRNFVAEYLKTRDKDAALVAFLSPDSSDWRLSLVKFETTFQQDEEKPKLKMVNETTPAKRWSFLIGENEGKHTVTGRFLNLLQSDVSPNIAELEDAFDVETVSEEFYEKYKELFLRMKDALDELVKMDVDIRADFEAKEISTVDFAKKTMGQMAFLYFLQKKGWFGVAPKAEWGTGQKNFLRDLFNRREELQVSHKLGVNFFDDIMEPLFYDALASDRRDSDDFYNRLNCRMPFLNGGLFEPIQGYAWTTTHIRLPDELFSNQNKTKEGDVGDGILDVFDRYNFTVNESEPLEKEVAVDPEMLGKVFENLLEIKDRKGKGAYYTPREIVHYMCQQCLINYLETEIREKCSVPREDIEFLIQNGSRIIENDLMVNEKGKETEAHRYMMPISIRSEAKRVDVLLADIKVCDPAVGSGAFPLGMLNEIIRARAALAVHQQKIIDYFELKKHTIINSLYGVDLDGGAVEIAKLRLWLALVVEENEPHPLPNIECKIMQGNSLISQYEGITLFDETILEDIKSIEAEKTEVTLRIANSQSRYFEVHGSEIDQAQKKEELNKIEKAVKGLKKRLQVLNDPSSLGLEEMSLFSPPQDRKIAHEKSLELQSLINQFIDTSHNKKKLKEKIDNLKWELIEVSLKEQDKTAKLDEIKALRKRHEKPFFIWKLEFSDVFREKGGFDVVIANPPYGAKLAEDQKQYLKAKYDYFIQRIPNSYQFFLILQKELVRPKGVVFNIIPNEFLFQIYMTKSRRHLLNHSRFLMAMNLGDNMFKAIVPTCVIGFKNEKNNADYDVPVVDFRKCSLREVGQRFIDNNFPPLSCSAIKAFPNSAFSFDIKKSSLIAKLEVHPKLLDFCIDVANGISTSHDKVYFIERELAQELSLEQAYIKDCLKGGDIRRFYSPKKSKNVILYINKEYSPACAPNINDYLERHKDELIAKSVEKKQGKRKWEILFRSRDKGLFENPKILFRQTGDSVVSCLDPRGEFYCIDSLNCAPLKQEYQYLGFYLVGLLNSKLINFYYREISQEGGRILAQVKPSRLKVLPIAINDVFTSKIEKISQEIVRKKSDAQNLSTNELEAQIDELVFDLYELNDDERQLVRDTVN